MNFESWFQKLHPEIPVSAALVVIKLTLEGATLPFIARYRKEQTGNLDEVAIQKVVDAKNNWDEIEKRKAFILGEIESQGKLTPELKEQIEKTFELGVLEDIYLPYKKKRKTRATVAREAGLEPLADWIWGVGHGEISTAAGETLESRALTFVDTEKGVADANAALEGAQHIRIDLYYVMRGVISPIYLLDAVIEVCILGAFVYGWTSKPVSLDTSTDIERSMRAY